MTRRFGSVLDLYHLSQECLEKDDFLGYQHFLMGCCSWLRGYIEWPIVKQHYEKCKLGVGYKSVFMKPPTWRNMRAFSLKERRENQYLVMTLFMDLQEFQSALSLVSGTQNQLRRLWRAIPPAQLTGIWTDTVIEKPEPFVTYPLELRRMAYLMRKEEKYDELYLISDWCEEYGGPELAPISAHFHNPECTHTFACCYLHEIAKGMDSSQRSF